MNTNNRPLDRDLFLAPWIARPTWSMLAIFTIAAVAGHHLGMGWRVLAAMILTSALAVGPWLVWLEKIGYFTDTPELLITEFDDDDQLTK
jgi:membrane-associated PAP2 superfamily phosphatase